MNQVLNPVALEHALAQHGVPALVKTDSYCTSDPAAPDPFGIGVLSTRPSINPPKVGLVQAPPNRKPADLSQITDHTTTQINPAAMPAGTELFFGYTPGDHLVAPNLIYSDSYTCSNQPFPSGPKAR